DERSRRAKWLSLCLIEDSRLAPGCCCYSMFSFHQRSQASQRTAAVPAGMAVSAAVAAGPGLVAQRPGTSGIGLNNMSGLRLPGEFMRAPRTPFFQFRSRRDKFTSEPIVKKR